ncbi:MAG: hypothetical protein ABIJ46_05240, partial [bacterium]
MIGVFDSGLGGLTVAKEILRQLPGRGVVYQLTQKTTPLGVVEWDIPCGILVCSMHGYTSFRPWGLQNAVPCRMD